MLKPYLGLIIHDYAICLLGMWFLNFLSITYCDPVPPARLLWTSIGCPWVIWSQTTIITPLAVLLWGATNFFYLSVGCLTPWSVSYSLHLFMHLTRDLEILFLNECLISHGIRCKQKFSYEAPKQGLRRKKKKTLMSSVKHAQMKHITLIR